MEPDKQGFFKETQQLIEEYIKERLLLLKFQAAEKTAGIVSALLVGICLGLPLLLIILLVSAAGVYFFARITANWYRGFFIVIAMYLLILLAVYIKRKSLLKTFSDLIIRLFFSDTQDIHDDTGT